MESFKSNLSSKLEFRLEYCWLPVPGRRENFTGLLICIICCNLSNNANGHFTLATLPLKLGRRGFKYPPKKSPISEKESNDNLDHYLDTGNFPLGRWSPSQIVYETNSGNVLVRIPRDEKNKQNWHAAAHSNKSFRNIPRCSKFRQQWKMFLMKSVRVPTWASQMKSLGFPHSSANFLSRGLLSCPWCI